MDSANPGGDRLAGATIELLGPLDAATYFPNPRSDPSSLPIERPPMRSTIRVARPASPLHEDPLLSTPAFAKIESLPTPNRRLALPILVRASMRDDDCSINRPNLSVVSSIRMLLLTEWSRGPIGVF